MRVAVHDYGGYAFIGSLCRRLAERDHEVLYAYAQQNPTPPGIHHDRAQGPNQLDIRGISTKEPLQKHQLWKRWRQEREYGALLSKQVLDWDPELVISANAPLDTQAMLYSACRRSDAPFIFWVQDLLGDAMVDLLPQRFGFLGRLVGEWYAWRERRLIAGSEMAVVISPDFRAHLASKGIPRAHMQVVENWAPLEDLPVISKDNPWSREMGLRETFNYIYAGSLGLKHDPTLLIELAQAVSSDRDARVVVVSEGLEATRLMNQAEQREISNMHVVPFQTMGELPHVLATADVLVAILTSGASEYSVPSKVLTYCCAQRPILLAVPPGNPAAKLVEATGAGVVVAPEDRAAFFERAIDLKGSPDRRSTMGHNGRVYAEAHFDLDAIADRFEAIFEMIRSKTNFIVDSHSDEK